MLDSMFFMTPAAPPNEKPRKTAILYSAAIFPGLGQFQQKRVAAGTLYFSAGLLASILFVAVFARHGADAIRIVWDGWTYGIDPERARTAFLPILKSASFLLLIYAANVYDVWYAWYRSLIAWREASRRPGAP